jgi:protein pelota
LVYNLTEGKYPLKIIEMRLKKGIVKVVPENLDDLWHLYNIIYKNDDVYAQTTREVQVEEEYARPKKGKRVTVFMGIKVENVTWDKSLNRLRVHGVVFDVPENVSSRGSYHTINVMVNKPLTIVKPKWQKHQTDRLERAKKVETTPLIILSIDDEGYCLGMFRQYGIDVKVEEKVSLPGKLDAEKREQAKHEFFKNALNALRNVWASTHNPIVIVGVGFVKNDFVKYLQRNAEKIAQVVIDVKSVNNTGIAGITEVLRSGVLAKALQHVRIIEEAQVIEEVLERLGKSRKDVAYGLGEVQRASKYGAVETLALADKTLREASDEDRITLEKLMIEAETKGGKIIVISTEHEAGTKLLSLGGIAALLRFLID